MKKDYSLGNALYSFFITITFLSTLLSDYFTGHFSVIQELSVICYLILQVVFHKYIKKMLNLTRRSYSYIQVALLTFSFIVFCYFFENMHMFFYMLFIQTTLTLLFMDVWIYTFALFVQLCSLVFLWFIDFSKISDKPPMANYIMTAVSLLIISWILINLINTIDFQSRRSLEREQSLDDLTKVIEVKCDEARRATKSKSNFLSNMSHEIRTPINSILGMNEMILRESHDTQILKYAENIKSSGSMLLSLINDILDFSKIEANNMEILPTEYQLSSVLNDILNMLMPKANDKNLSLTVKADPHVPNYLYGDEIRIRQIVTNLITNSIKYTDKGKITLSVYFNRISDNKINLIFEVNDTGRGIKKQDIEKLFKSFKRVDESKNRNIEGTGLGLAITQRLVEMMDGNIDVESIYGVGSKFTVTLPQPVKRHNALGDFEAQFKAGISEHENYHESFHAPNAKILIVDDNEMNLVVATGLLKQTLIHIDTASGGKKCIELLRKNKYDIILLDHMMPEMDGLQTLKILKEEKLCENTPVIALTANAISGAREMYLGYGFQDYLSKPIIGKDLEKMLQTWLSKELIDTNVSRKSLIDRNVGMSYCAQNEDIYKKILNSYLHQSEEYLVSVPQYIKSKDWKNYAITAHAIKSSSLTIGASNLSKLAKTQETAAKDGNIDKVLDGWEEMFDTYKLVLKEIEKEH